MAGGIAFVSRIYASERQAATVKRDSCAQDRRDRSPHRSGRVSQQQRQQRQRQQRVSVWCGFQSFSVFLWGRPRWWRVFWPECLTFTLPPAGGWQARARRERQIWSGWRLPGLWPGRHRIWAGLAPCGRRMLDAWGKAQWAVDTMWGGKAVGDWGVDLKNRPTVRR